MPDRVLLRDLLRARGALPPERAARILEEIAAALAPLHARGEAFGALSPERVRLDEAAGRVELAEPATTPDAPPSWPTYLSPEQIDGRPADPRSDVYTLGLLGWEMLAGQQPWEGESLYGVVVKQREHDLPRLTTLRPGLPRALVHAIEGALHKHPDDRWRSADELLAQLHANGDAPPLAPAAVVVDARRPVPPGTVVPLSGAEAVAAAATLASHAVDAAEVAPERIDRVERVVPADAVPADAVRAVPRARPVVPPPVVDDGDAPRPRRRWLAVAALGVALLAAGAGGLVVMQGRTESRETKAWLDSLTTGTSAGVILEDSANTPAARARSAAARSRRDSLARVDAARRAQVAEASARDSAAVDATAPARPAPPVPATEPAREPAREPSPARPTVPAPDSATPPDTSPFRNVAASRGDRCASPATADQRSCLLTLLDRGDARLNRAYAARLASLSGDPDATRDLRQAQRTWLAERDAECARRGAGREGALWARSRAQCLIGMGELRAVELEGRG